MHEQNASHIISRQPKREWHLCFPHFSMKDPPVLMISDSEISFWPCPQQLQCRYCSFWQMITMDQRWCTPIEIPLVYVTSSWDANWCNSLKKGLADKLCKLFLLPRWCFLYYAKTGWASLHTLLQKHGAQSHEWLERVFWVFPFSIYLLVLPFKNYVPMAVLNETLPGSGS